MKEDLESVIFAGIMLCFIQLTTSSRVALTGNPVHVINELRNSVILFIPPRVCTNSMFTRREWIRKRLGSVTYIGDNMIENETARERQRKYILKWKLPHIFYM